MKLLLPAADGADPIVLPPTGTCFDDALDLYEALARVGVSPAKLAGITIVHGLCERDGSVFAHGWNQTQSFCVQAGVTPTAERAWYLMYRKAFEAFFHPSYVRRYTLAEALEENDVHETFGPWDERILAHCLQSSTDRQALGYAKR